MKSIYFVIILLLAFILCARAGNSEENTKGDITSQIHICPLIRCLPGLCENGFIINQFGCTTCECNPCRFGQPLFRYPCGQGQGNCTAHGGLCKVRKFDHAYCCPNERDGCCPPIPFPQNFFCLKPNCKNDAQCPTGQKCCRPCSRCANITRT